MKFISKVTLLMLGLSFSVITSAASNIDFGYRGKIVEILLFNHEVTQPGGILASILLDTANRNPDCSSGSFQFESGIFTGLVLNNTQFGREQLAILTAIKLNGSDVTITTVGLNSCGVSLVSY